MVEVSIAHLFYGEALHTSFVPWSKASSHLNEPSVFLKGPICPVYMTEVGVIYRGYMETLGEGVTGEGS